MNGPEEVQLRHPQQLAAATSTLTTLNTSSPYGPYPFITAALAALSEGDLDGYFLYAEGAARLTMLHTTTITDATRQIKFAFGLTD